VLERGTRGEGELIAICKTQSLEKNYAHKKKLGKEKHTWMYHNILKESAV
jgi:hypothetical protein